MDERRAPGALGSPARQFMIDPGRALRRARGFLVDLDGTLIRTDQAVEGAIEFMRRFGDRSVVLSNNSSDTERDLSRRLSAIGFNIDAPRIVLAGVETIDAVARRWPGARVHMLADPGIVEIACARGLRPVDDAPDVVVVMRTERFDYALLMQAANAVRDGARFVAANPDLAHPGPGGRLVPETGALTAAIAAAAGRGPDLVIGKPAPHLFHRGLSLLGLPPDEVLMIGDNPLTDAAGAAAAGLAHVILDARVTWSSLLGD
jgi:HAD superfamily hydrolase (TIGR01450 family)